MPLPDGTMLENRPELEKNDNSLHLLKEGAEVRLPKGSPLIGTIAAPTQPPPRRGRGGGGGLDPMEVWLKIIWNFIDVDLILRTDLQAADLVGGAVHLVSEIDLGGCADCCSECNIL